MNHAKQQANAISPDLRDSELEYIENFRKQIDLGTTKIENILEKPPSWYTNRHQNTAGSHEFSIYDLELVREVIFRVAKDEPLEIESIEEDAMKNSHEVISDLYQLMEPTEVTPSQLEESLDKPDGWFESLDAQDISLRDYYEAYMFVEYILVVYFHEGYIDNQDIDLDTQYISVEEVAS